jgi:hypothetical protein
MPAQMVGLVRRLRYTLSLRLQPGCVALRACTRRRRDFNTIATARPADTTLLADRAGRAEDLARNRLRLRHAVHGVGKTYDTTSF